jgi:uncharacterized protein (DUF934 family)
MLEHHPRIIKGHDIVADDWQVLRLDEGQTAEQVELPEGKLIVPLAVWQARQAELGSRAALGVWLAPDERAEAIKADLPRLAVIAIDFPKFTDGRGYSTAFNLRKRLGWTGELRAVGDVLRDQLFSMRRVGFDAYAVRADRSVDDALKSLTDFTETYQASIDQPLPLFRRTERKAEPAGALDVGGGI